MEMKVLGKNYMIAKRIYNILIVAVELNKTTWELHSQGGLASINFFENSKTENQIFQHSCI